MMMKRSVFTFALAVLFASPAMALRPAEPGPVDSRIRSVTYSERDVVRVNGHYGFTTTLEFQYGETVQTVSIGDSEAWQIVRPEQVNLLFVKPIDQNANTNMTVVTDKRIYNFMLFAQRAQNHDSPGLTFHVRFRYPDDERAMIVFEETEERRVASLAVSGPDIAPEEWNFDYGYAGSERLRPQRVFDDGKFTYFSFPEFETTPAIFIADENREEQLVNFTTKGRYVVVERLARQFTLRDGDVATCVFNRSYPSSQFDGGAPMRVSSSGELFDDSFDERGADYGGE